MSRAGAWRSEEALCRAWEQRCFGPEALVDSAGRRLTVVFPGRRWGGPGPDFRGAVLAREDGTLIRGDVEVHLRSSGWRAHGHAADPLYRNVMLHVVGAADATASADDGRSIPSLLLAPAEDSPASISSLPAPCTRHPADVRRVLREAGRQRFAAKTARLEGDITWAGPEQTLWRGVAEALGYSANADPMQRLAEAVTWPEAAASAGDGSQAVSALLLGSAGLLEAFSPLEANVWRSLEARGARCWLSVSAWHRAAVRPASDPARRLRGLAEIARRWSALRGEHITELLAAVRSPGGAPRAPLEALFASPFVGAGRARILVVNVLLPFAAACGLDEAASVYERMPAEPHSRPTRYMATQLGLPPGTRLTACDQQGLLHLFKSSCTARHCERCPAVRPAAVAS